MVDAQRTRKRVEGERDRLLEVRRGLEADGLDERDLGGELSSLDQHQADVGSEVFEREKELSILHQVDADLAEVADALLRLDSGAYGTCQTCGGPIPGQRLDAVPATRFCADHEARGERRLRSLLLPPDSDDDGEASAYVIAGREAAGHWEYLPTDDEPDVLELGPEEQALHATYLGTARSEAMAPAEVELAEMRDAGARSDERFEALRDEDAYRAAVEAAILDEKGLGEAPSRRRPALWRRLVRRRERRRGAEEG